MKPFVTKLLCLWLSACVLLVFSACRDASIETNSAPSSIETLQNEDNSVLVTSSREPEKASLSGGKQVIKIQIGDTTLTATLVDNTSTQALLELLSQGPLTMEMEDYGDMEKVGDIGAELPRNDEQTTTQAGDLILYQGNSFVIYYAPNTWNFTRLGQIDHINEGELIELLGEGDVTVTLSLENLPISSEKR